VHDVILGYFNFSAFVQGTIFTHFVSFIVGVYLTKGINYQ
jgi:hypothetical protein